LIAAGLGARMGDFTRTLPKCLLPIAGRPLLDWALGNFRRWNCDPTIAVVGHLADAIDRPGLTKVFNKDYRDNNILHSFMSAASYLQGPTLVSYSDILVDQSAFQTLMSTPGEIVVVIDMDWRSYYVDRTWHPSIEAEKAYVDSSGSVQRIGKHLSDEPPDGMHCGEFIGLWRMSEKGTETWLQHFRRMDALLDFADSFQNATEWRKAYVTDMLQELIDQGVNVKSALIHRGWAELDTEEDYQRLPSIAVRQNIKTVGNLELSFTSSATSAATFQGR
jgi:choline kinase